MAMIENDVEALEPAVTGTRMEQVVPGPVVALLAVFDAELKDVAFPDVDREVLQDAAGVVVTRADEVARLEASLAEARRALQESQDALLGKAQRALSYARIYAEENPELAARLEAVGPIRAPRKGNRTEVPGAVSAVPLDDGAPVEGKKRGRGRPKVSGLLFSEEGGAQEAATAQA